MRTTRTEPSIFGAAVVAASATTAKRSRSIEGPLAVPAVVGSRGSSTVLRSRSIKGPSTVPAVVGSRGSCTVLRSRSVEKPPAAPAVVLIKGGRGSSMVLRRGWLAGDKVTVAVVVCSRAEVGGAAREQGRSQPGGGRAGRGLAT
eukprot:scaffold133253_cov81-Phaeocystis_antarctica.AAC.1